MRISAMTIQTVRPPTENSANYHVMRAHLRILHWKRLTATGFRPQEWRWHISYGWCNPNTSNIEPAPMELLNTVQCVILTAERHVGWCYVTVV